MTIIIVHGMVIIVAVARDGIHEGVIVNDGDIHEGVIVNHHGIAAIGSCHAIVVVVIAVVVVVVEL